MPVAPTPRPLTTSEKHIVHIFKKKITKFVHKVSVVKRKITILKNNLIVAPQPRRPIIKRKIVKLTKIVKRYHKTIRHFKKTIKRIVFSKPAFSKPAPKVNLQENKTINIFKHKVNKIIRRVKIVKKKIVHFQRVYRTAPAPRRLIIKKKIVHFRRVYKKLVKKIVHIKRTIRRISQPVPKPITKKDI